jgi:AcrR family transcriptional regulator
MDDRRTREDWLRAARLALLHKGPEGVRVEPLARDLGVTKGSFYWHFRDRGELLETLLVEWEQETALLTEALRLADPRDELPAIVAELDRRNTASEKGESPSDAAIFAWAASDAAVARRANAAEAERLRLFRRLTGKKDLADLFYYAYHGFLLRRRRVPSAAGDFAAIAQMALRVFGSAPKRKPKRKSRARLARGAVGAAAFLLAFPLHAIVVVPFVPFGLGFSAAICGRLRL